MRPAAPGPTAAAALIPIAHQETHLPTPRLAGELTRTTFQLRLHAGEIETGRPFGARIDRADPVVLKTTGMAWQDLAVAEAVHRRWRAEQPRPRPV